MNESLMTEIEQLNEYVSELNQLKTRYENLHRANLQLKGFNGGTELKDKETLEKIVFLGKGMQMDSLEQSMKSILNAIVKHLTVE